MIGAMAGLIVTGLAAVSFVQDQLYPRSLIQTLLWLGGSGLVGGALIGAVIGALFRRPRQIALFAAVSGVFAGPVACVLSIIGIFVYAGIPWPDPAPYPAAQAQEDKSCSGSWGCARTKIYTVSVGMDEIQGYYDREMRRYCVSAWRFHPLTVAVGDYGECREAECKTRRVGLGQRFRVQLCAASETETRVVQHTIWEE
jgi:hypothetical protein